MVPYCMQLRGVFLQRDSGFSLSCFGQSIHWPLNNTWKKYMCTYVSHLSSCSVLPPLASSMPVLRSKFKVQAYLFPQEIVPALYLSPGVGGGPAPHPIATREVHLARHRIGDSHQPWNSIHKRPSLVQHNVWILHFYPMFWLYEHLKAKLPFKNNVLGNSGPFLYKLF